MADQIKKDEKPFVQLSGQDGNIYNLAALARKALKKAGQEGNAKKLMDKLILCKSYAEALELIGEYVEVG